MNAGECPDCREIADLIASLDAEVNARLVYDVCHGSHLKKLSRSQLRRIEAVNGAEIEMRDE